jgi:hypothetical protein
MSTVEQLELKLSELYTFVEQQAKIIENMIKLFGKLHLLMQERDCVYTQTSKPCIDNTPQP